MASRGYSRFSSWPARYSIGAQVAVAVARQAEEDDVLAPLRIRTASFLEGGLDGVRVLRSGEDALSVGEEHGGIEAPSNGCRAEAGKGECAAFGCRKSGADEGHGFTDAALWLAIGGGAEVSADFEAALARGKPSAVLLEAIGWYGDLRFVDTLLALLEAGQKAAVGALQRLTGASLTDDVPEPEYAPGEEPFVRGFSPPADELELTADPAVWKAWWHQHGGRAVLTQRYRWGHLWSSQDNLWELEQAPASPRERRLAFHELVARTGAFHPFDPQDFVARQQAAIAVWREAPELRRAVTGAWALSFSR